VVETVEAVQLPTISEGVLFRLRITTAVLRSRTITGEVLLSRTITADRLIGVLLHHKVDITTVLATTIVDLLHLGVEDTGGEVGDHRLPVVVD
jgi:hypothetical protein